MNGFRRRRDGRGAVRACDKAAIGSTAPTGRASGSITPLNRAAERSEAALGSFEAPAPIPCPWARATAKRCSPDRAAVSCAAWAMRAAAPAAIRFACAMAVSGAALAPISAAKSRIQPSATVPAAVPDSPRLVSAASNFSYTALNSPASPPKRT